MLSNGFFKSRTFTFLLGQLIVVLVAWAAFSSILRTISTQNEDTVKFRADITARVLVLEQQKKQVDVLKTKVGKLDKEVPIRKK